LEDILKKCFVHPDTTFFDETELPVVCVPLPCVVALFVNIKNIAMLITEQRK